ncbi:MAG: pyridoxal phosphate-dependent aminotransferase [Patescibacteria group bacterium]
MFNRTKNIRLSVIKQMELAASKYPDVVSLAQGIPSFDTPDFIKGRAANALARGVVAKYSLSPGLPELRELIEINLAREGMFYDWQKEIVITAGSIEGITATILAITEPGEEIIMPSPTYTSYREVIRLAGCEPVFVPLNENKGWAFELVQFEKAITPKTRAIFYCNPNNPTGTVYSKGELLALAELAKKHNLYLISDEVYKDFIFTNDSESKANKDESNDTRIFSLAQLPELRERVIRIFSFSKSHAVTGWRIGYLHSDEKIVKEILKVHDSLVTCAPVISQYAALGALEMKDEELDWYIKEYAKRRQLICDRLDRLRHIFNYVRPNGAYFVFPKINPEVIAKYFPKNVNKNWGEDRTDLSWQFALSLLDKIQVALVPGIAFGPGGEGHIRISFGRSEADINKAFDRMNSLFRP